MGTKNCDKLSTSCELLESTLAPTRQRSSKNHSATDSSQGQPRGLRVKVPPGTLQTLHHDRLLPKDWGLAPRLFRSDVKTPRRSSGWSDYVGLHLSIAPTSKIQGPTVLDDDVLLVFPQRLKTRWWLSPPVPALGMKGHHHVHVLGWAQLALHGMNPHVRDSRDIEVYLRRHACWSELESDRPKCSATHSIAKEIDVNDII